MDGILMADPGSEQEISMCSMERDCFGAVFTDIVRQCQFVQVAPAVVSKMTSSLQLADTDFRHEFKALMAHAG